MMRCLPKATVLSRIKHRSIGPFSNKIPNCRLIVSYSTGTDHMDLEAAQARGIRAVGVAGYCTDDVAEHALAMLLSCARSLHQTDRLLRATAHWDITTSAPRRRRLSQQTLGIVGVGRIGSALAGRLQALGMRVLGFDPYVTDFAGTLVATLEELLEQSDYVSLHAPLTPETEGMIGAAELARMKPDAFLINCARGKLVDEHALLAALDSQQIAGAALDVRAEEPVKPGDPLVCHDGVLSTPHSGAFSLDAIADLRAIVVRYLEEALT